MLYGYVMPVDRSVCAPTMSLGVLAVTGLWHRAPRSFAGDIRAAESGAFKGTHQSSRGPLKFKPSQKRMTLGDAKRDSRRDTLLRHFQKGSSTSVTMVSCPWSNRHAPTHPCAACNGEGNQIFKTGALDSVSHSICKRALNGQNQLKRRSSCKMDFQRLRCDPGPASFLCRRGGAINCNKVLQEKILNSSFVEGLLSKVKWWVTC